MEKATKATNQTSAAKQRKHTVINPLESEEFFGQQYNSTSELPDPESRIKVIATGVIEVIKGMRSAEQLSRDLTEDAYMQLQYEVAKEQRQRTKAGQKAKYISCTFRNLMKSSPRDGVVESVALVSVANRLQAVAIRLEGINHRWRATSVRYI
ncbi:Rv3235 family protein [Rhodoluna sp.]|uniref:Rv3235 family protein n=1 Tax=Rhodoluna sp. TaxID=1969481 RepID=UPI0025D676BE|nr:Rv3235 family protein [Rhodoluna sp.]